MLTRIRKLIGPIIFIIFALSFLQPIVAPAAPINSGGTVKQTLQAER